MKKHSLINVHGLLVQIRRELRNYGELPEDAYSEYDERNISPMSLHRRKGAHREAIDLLGEGILRTIAHQHDEDVPEGGEPPLPSSVDDWELPTQ